MRIAQNQGELDPAKDIKIYRKRIFSNRNKKRIIQEIVRLLCGED